MFPIVSKRPLNEAGTVLEYVIKAPAGRQEVPARSVHRSASGRARRARSLTIADYDREAGTVTIIGADPSVEPGDAPFVGRAPTSAAIGPNFDEVALGYTAEMAIEAIAIATRTALPQLPASLSCAR